MGVGTMSRFVRRRRGREGCEGVLARTRADMFPGVGEGRFGFFAPRGTGHDLMLHRSVGETKGEVRGFLDLVK